MNRAGDVFEIGEVMGDNVFGELLMDLSSPEAVSWFVGCRWKQYVLLVYDEMSTDDWETGLHRF